MDVYAQNEQFANLHIDFLATERDLSRAGNLVWDILAVLDRLVN